MRRAVLLLCAAACSGTSTPKAPTGHAGGPPAPLVSTPAGPDDVQVATVNGKPVFGSCVTAQAARGATRQQALQQCVDFELLAQAAERYATAPEVVNNTRTALVSELIAKDYESRYTKPADFGSFWNRIVDKNRASFDHTEARASAYARINVDKSATPEAVEKAHAIASEIAAALVNERGLMMPHLEEIAKRVVGDRASLEVKAVPAYLDNGGLVPEYAKPLFAIPEVGRTTGPIRTQWGWDIILLTVLYPAEHPTEDQVVAKVLADVQRSFFPQWVNEVAKKSGITVKIFDDKVPRLEDL